MKWHNILKILVVSSSDGSDCLSLTKVENFFPVEEKFVKYKQAAIHIRPVGKHVQLEQNQDGLLVALGITPSPTEIQQESFLDLLHGYSSKSDSIQCLQNQLPGVTVNRRSCLWCQNNTACKEIENNYNNQAVSFSIFSKTDDPDRELIKQYINGNHYSTKTEIFYNQVDPFKPYFDITKERKIRIFQLYDSVVFQPTQSSSWGHIFYCPPLLRTITLLEAQVIDFLPIDNSRLHGPSKEDMFPSGEDFTSLFDSEFGIDAVRGKKTFIDAFKQKILASKQESSAWYNVYNLLNFTQRKLSTGLYNIKTELNHNLSYSGDLYEVIAIFLWEIWKKIHSSPEQYREHDIIEERANAIILYPKSMQSLEVNSSVKIVRLIPVEGLSKPWVVIDGDSEFIADSRELPSIIPIFSIETISPKIYNSPPSVLSRMIHSYRRPLQLIHWNPEIEHTIEQIAKASRISWFPPNRLIDALSMNTVLRSNIANIGGAEFQDFRDIAMRFLSRFFKIPQRPSSQDPEEVQQFYRDIIDLISTIENPMFQRSGPYKLLSEVSEHHSRKFSRFIQHNRIVNEAENSVTEIFKLTRNHPNPRFVGSSVTFTRKIENSAYGKTEIKHPFKVKSSGFDGLSDSHLSSQFCRALDWVHNPDNRRINDQIIFPSQRGIWVSKTIDELLRKGNQTSLDLSDAIAKRSKSRTFHQVMFVSTQEEMPFITQITGKIERKEIFEAPAMVIWEAPMAAKDSSPNFFFAGKVH